MSLHLFSTPVECPHCGTVVDDPTVDRCPRCGELLKERRTPARLAGVERRYGNVRFLLGALRFLAVITAVVGVLLFIFSVGTDGLTWAGRLLVMLGSLLVAGAIFTITAFFDVALDMEENTRASFRLQQMLLEELQTRAREP